MVALTLRRGAQRGEIRACPGLRKALTPPNVEIGDARQKALLLRLGAKGYDDRPDHRHAEA